MNEGSASLLCVDAGDLPLGGGLLAIVRPALELLEVGGRLAVLSTSRAAAEDLPSWCRVEQHRYLGAEPAGEATRHTLEKGPLGLLRGHDATAPPPLPAVPTTADVLLALPFPARADPGSGFAPRGALWEAGGPVYPFPLVERDRVAPPEIGALYDQAVASQWQAATAIPWEKARGVPPPLERAVVQLMTFLAENELAALYVPAKFLPRIHPAFVESAAFLATQLADEARHLDAFLKRARLAGGAASVSSATTSRSLLSLLELEDFLEASFLLSVLGEGTFLDLLRFIEIHAPDEATAQLCRLARADEARHVHFGMAHVRHGLATDPGLAARLQAAVARRAASLGDVSGVPHRIQDALTVLAARGTDPRSIARGHEAFRELLQTMHDGRTKRLQKAGFSTEEADLLSALHTPNFM